MNVRPDGDAFRFRLDLKAIGDLLRDYCARDLWPVIEAAASRPALHVIVGGASDAFSPADRERLAEDARRLPKPSRCTSSRTPVTTCTSTIPNEPRSR